jgi:hypothetical protein
VEGETGSPDRPEVVGRIAGDALEVATQTRIGSAPGGDRQHLLGRDPIRGLAMGNEVGNRLAAAGDDDGLPRLDPAQEAGGLVA